MKFISDFKKAIKGNNKLCDPLLIYIIIGILKFSLLYLVYLQNTKEGFAPVQFDSNCPHCNQASNSNNKYTKFDLIMNINIMFYLYVIYGMFLQLLCKNNMKNAAWFVLLYPFISKLVWSMII